VPEVDAASKVVLGNGLVQIAEDLVRVGNRVIPCPRFEFEPKGVQVGVGPDARVAEKIPGSPDRVAPVDDGERPAVAARA
jgi:hypothetical protein